LQVRKYPKIASIIWALILGIVMLLPQDQFPDSQLLSYDKLAHIAVFAMLSFLISVACSHKGRGKTTKSTIRALTICLVYSSLLECCQHFVPGRTLDGYDFLANYTGGLVGVIIFSIFIRQKFVIDKLII
jgi:VanZ family protein